MKVESKLERSAYVRSWLSGDVSRCLVLLPEELSGPQSLLRAVGLEGAKTQLLVAGEVRPAIEPHPDLVDHLSSGEVTDVVFVACTALRRFDGGAKEHEATGFLEDQLRRLVAYRGLPNMGSLAGVRLHGWLWDCARARLTPYSHEQRELVRERSVGLTTDEVELLPTPHQVYDAAS
jgi:hypothetical protein